MANGKMTQRSVSLESDLDRWIDERAARHRTTFAQEVRALLWHANEDLDPTGIEIEAIRAEAQAQTERK